MMAFVQYGHQTEAERAADQHKRDMEQQLKELGEWQDVIRLALSIMMRGGSNPASMKQIEEATEEYGRRFSAIMSYVSAIRLTGPKRG
jgi:hypothetical protein